jgi:hypothetical protein
MYDEYMYLISRYLLYYKRIDNEDDSRFERKISKSESIHIPLNKLVKNCKKEGSEGEKLVEEVWRMAEVIRAHEGRLSEEEKAEREIEKSYLMLHIYENPNQ